MAPQPDQDLIVRAKRYEPEALAEAFERNFDRIFSFLYAGLTDEDLAEEMSGRVFSSALAQLASYHDREAGMTIFLYRVALATLGQYLRQIAKEARRNPAFGEEDEQAIVRAAMGGLSDGQMRVLMLRFYAGMDSQEIGDVTGFSAGRVQALQHRGLTKLHAFFLRHGVVS